MKFVTQAHYPNSNPHTFTCVVDTTQIMPDGKHPIYFVRRDLTICDLWGNPIPQTTLTQNRVELGNLYTPYTSVCWWCWRHKGRRVLISAMFCRRSENPHMGYHCTECGHDLTEYYNPKGAIVVPFPK
jgi:hypothetical protein